MCACVYACACVCVRMCASACASVRAFACICVCLACVFLPRCSVFLLVSIVSLTPGLLGCFSSPWCQYLSEPCLSIQEGLCMLGPNPFSFDTEQRLRVLEADIQRSRIRLIEYARPSGAFVGLIRLSAVFAHPYLLLLHVSLLTVGVDARCRCDCLARVDCGALLAVQAFECGRGVATVPSKPRGGARVRDVVAPPHCSAPLNDVGLMSKPRPSRMRQRHMDAQRDTEGHIETERGEGGGRVQSLSCFLRESCVATLRFPTCTGACHRLLSPTSRRPTCTSVARCLRVWRRLTLSSLDTAASLLPGCRRRLR